MISPSQSIFRGKYHCEGSDYLSFDFKGHREVQECLGRVEDTTQPIIGEVARQFQSAG